MAGKNKKMSDPYPTAFKVLEKLDFIEEVYPETEYITEHIPVTEKELLAVTGMEEVADSELAGHIKWLAEFVEALTEGQLMLEYEIQEAFYRKTKAKFMCIEHVNALSMLPDYSFQRYCERILSSLKKAGYFASYANEYISGVKAGHKRQTISKKIEMQSRLLIKSLL